MHIGLFLPDLNAGGAERVMLALAGRFAQRGHKVDLVLLNATGELIDAVPPGVNLEELLRRPIGNRLLAAVAACQGWYRYLSAKRPDAVLSSITGTNLVAALCSILSGRRSRLVLREARNAVQVRGRLEALAIRMLYPCADSIIAVSKGVAQGLTENFGIPTRKISVVPNPIDIDRIRAMARQFVVAPSPENHPYILAAGRLVTMKDYPLLLKAFQLVRQTHPDTHLVILGEGPERQALERMIQDLGLQEHVHLPGHIDNPYPYFSHARVFALSSRSEGMPNVLLEALAFRLPVVATDCPSGPREILQDGLLGELCPVGDWVALARSIETQLQKCTNTEVIPSVMAYAIDTVVDQYLAQLEAVPAPEEYSSRGYP